MTTQIHKRSVAACLGLAAFFAAAAQSSGQTFSVTPYTFNQSNSVTQVTASDSTLFNFNGASFLADQADFNTALTVGRIFNYTLTGSQALMVGDAGTRSVISMAWGGPELRNNPGNDFAVYTQNINGVPAAFMVRVHNAFTEEWSKWRFQYPDDFDFTYNTFACGFDLTNFGILGQADVDAIELANLLPSDAVLGDTGQGEVLLQGNIVVNEAGEGVINVVNLTSNNIPVAYQQLLSGATTWSVPNQGPLSVTPNAPFVANADPLQSPFTPQVVYVVGLSTLASPSTPTSTLLNFFSCGAGGANMVLMLGVGLTGVMLMRKTTRRRTSQR